jgi:hypothetical protein
MAIIYLLQIQSALKLSLIRYTKKMEIKTRGSTILAAILQQQIPKTTKEGNQFTQWATH